MPSLIDSPPRVAGSLPRTHQQQHSTRPPKPPYSPGGPNSPCTKNNAGSSAMIEHQNQNAEEHDEEHASLIEEIRRLERSMNVALSASRDEVETLKKASEEKKEALRQMNEELEENKSKMGIHNNNNSGVRSRRLASSSNSSSSHTAAGGGENKTNNCRKNLFPQKSFLRRVTISGAGDALADRPFFGGGGGGGGRLLLIKDDEQSLHELQELRESYKRLSDRRLSDPRSIDALMELNPDTLEIEMMEVEPQQQQQSRSRQRTGSCGDVSRHSRGSKCSRGSRGSRGSKTSSNKPGRERSANLLRSLSFNKLNHSDGALNYGGNGDDSDSSTSDDEENAKEELIQYEKTLEAKERQLAKLREEQSANSDKLLGLQSELQSIQARSRSQCVENNAVMEDLKRRKEMLMQTVKQREQLIFESEGRLAECEDRIETLEREIQQKNDNNQIQNSDGHPPQDAAARNTDNNNACCDSMTTSELEDGIRKYQLRQKIHSQYTAKAIESFMHSLSMAKQNDVDGTLFQSTDDHEGSKEGEGGDDGNDNDTANEGNEEHEQELDRQHLVEGISLDVDIQLNNLERMIKEVSEKVTEYELLSSPDRDQGVAPSLAEGGTRESNSEGADSGNDSAAYSGNRGGSPLPEEHHNELLLLSKECAYLLEDLLSTVSSAVKSTIGSKPNSFSIEFRPAFSSLPKNGGEGGKTNNNSKSNDHQSQHQNLDEGEEEEEEEEEGDSNDSEKETIPYFEIRQKQLRLQEIQRNKQRLDTSIALLQNDMKSTADGMASERRAHYETMSELQEKLRRLTGRLEEGGEEIYGLVQELELLKESSEKEEGGVVVTEEE